MCYILKQRRFFAVLAFVIVFPRFLAAEEPDKSSTRVAKINGEFLLSQTITFLSVPDILHYKVEIEQLAGEQFIPLHTMQTETNSVEVSLKAGLYRYRIFAYNKMNLLDGISDWQEFEVLAAVEPAAESYQPFYGLYYELPDFPRSITVRGRDFFPESEFALVRQHDKFDWSGIDLEGRRDVLFPDNVTVNEDCTAAVLDFSLKKLKRGEYYIFVRNPGGLWTTLGQVRVGYRKNTGWTFSFGWSPMIAAFDREKATYGSEDKPRLDLFNPRGAYIRLGWFPVKTKIGNFGLEMNWLFLADNYDISDYQGISGPGDYLGTIRGGHMDIVYQKTFSSWKNWQLELRAGAGGSDDYDDTVSDFDGDIPFPFMLNFGASAQYFIWKNLYAEAGLDFQYVTGVGHFMMRPALGMGWQFGRWTELTAVDNALKRGEDPSVPVTDIPKNEITLSVGWSPVIPLSDYTYTEWEGMSMAERNDLQLFNPLGMYLRTAYLPYRWGGSKLGFEFALHMLDPLNRKDDENFYKYLDLLRYMQFGVLYQRRLPKNWQLNARLGIGISNSYANDVGDIEPALNAGLSIQRFFWRGFYAEAGLDVITSFYNNKARWMLNPGIGIGWQFNRDAETGLRLK
jgi:hypothetical protein